MPGQRLKKKHDTAVFVVEYDPVVRRAISAALAGLPWPVYTFDTPGTFLESLEGPQNGCVVATVNQVDMSIPGLLQAMEQGHHRIALILLSHDIEIPEAVAAMRAGAHDVLPLPVVERALRRQVRSAIEQSGPSHGAAVLSNGSRR